MHPSKTTCVKLFQENRPNDDQELLLLTLFDFDPGIGK